MNAAEKGMVMHHRVNAIGVAVARQGDAAGINEGREHEIKVRDELRGVNFAGGMLMRDCGGGGQAYCG